MANPFEVRVPNALEALAAGEQGYNTGRDWVTQFNRQRTLADLGRGANINDVATRLLASGDLTGLAVLNQANNQRDYALRERGVVLDEKKANSPTTTWHVDPTTGFPTAYRQHPFGGPVEQMPIGGRQQPQAGSNLTGEAYLQTIDPGRASQIKALVEGRLPPPSRDALRNPQITSLLKDAANYDPGFDLNVWTQRNATVRDFSSGKAAQNVTSLNTVIGHMGDLMDKAKALDNYRFPAINAVTNAVAYQAGDKRVGEYRLAAKAVADELARVFRQVGMSDNEIRQWHSALSENLSPEQHKGVLSTAVGLLESRLNALGDQRSRGFSNRVEARSLLNPGAQKRLKQIEDWAGVSSGVAPNQTPTAPQSRVFNTPDEVAAAVRAKLLQSGDAFQTPDGRTKYVP